MTKGGLETIRSYVSSATGSKSEPSRRSAAGAPESARVSLVKPRARGLRSVAVTPVACCAACSAWIPDPVPRSSARPTGVRTVIPASVVDAPPTPSTTPSSWLPIPPAPPTPHPGSETMNQSCPSGPPYGLTSTVARTPSSVRATQPSATHSSNGSAAAACPAGTGCCSRKSRTSVSSGVPPRVARRAGTVSLRASAAYAGAPSRSSRPSAVKAAASRASRIRGEWSGAGRLVVLTRPLWLLPLTTPAPSARGHADSRKPPVTGARRQSEFPSSAAAWPVVSPRWVTPWRARRWGTARTSRPCTRPG